MLRPNLHRFFKYTCNGKYSLKDLDRLCFYIDTTPGLGPEEDCWEWRGELRKDGYGVFNIFKNGKKITLRSHRAAYEMSTGILITDGKFILHKCDNPKCVKAYMHLSMGTHQDNMDDMVSKGRHTIGENNIHAKLTWNKVNKIRRLYSTGKYKHKQLANKFNTSQANISFIINNRRWVKNK